VRYNVFVYGMRLSIPEGYQLPESSGSSRYSFFSREHLLRIIHRLTTTTKTIVKSREFEDYVRMMVQNAQRCAAMQSR
jgi:hypothetical protein